MSSAHTLRASWGYCMEMATLNRQAWVRVSSAHTLPTWPAQRAGVSSRRRIRTQPAAQQQIQGGVQGERSSSAGGGHARATSICAQKSSWAVQCTPVHEHAAIRKSPSTWQGGGGGGAGV